MRHPGHIPAIAEARCDSADPAPALEELLAIHPASMTLHDIREGLRGRWHLACLRRVLRADRRFARVGEDLFTLRSPGIIEYRGLVPEMRAIVQSEGEMRVDDLATQISLAFDVPEERVRAYARMRPFASCNGIVRMRPEHSRAPRLWDLPEAETVSLVQVRRGFTYDIYVAACESSRPEQDAHSAVASLLQLSEDVPTGVAVTKTCECVDGGEVVFTWDGFEVEVVLPAGFLAKHSLHDDMVVRLHFHSFAGHIRSVSLHVLRADAAIEQRLIHQRVPAEGQWRHELAADMEIAVDDMQQADPGAESARWEVARAAVEKLLLTSYGHYIWRKSAGGGSDASGGTAGSGSAGAPTAPANGGRISGKPGYCQITVCTGSAASSRDQWVRWQWAEDDTLQLQFGLNNDPVREAGHTGHLLQQMRAVRGMDSRNFTYTTRMRMSDVDPIQMAALVTAVIRGGMQASLESRWFIGHPTLAAAAWGAPEPGDVVWKGAEPIEQAARSGFAPAQCFEPPAWLGPWLAPSALANRPLVKPPVVTPSRGAGAARAAAEPVSGMGQSPAVTDGNTEQEDGVGH